MKPKQTTNGMYALLVVVAALLATGIYFACSADDDFATNNTNWPSGFDNDTHEFKGSGDMQVAKSVTEGLSKVNWNIPIFKIYPIKDRKYVIFNAKSTRYDFY